MFLRSLEPTVEEFHQATGWKIDQQGACQGHLCVPLGSGALAENRVDVATVAGRLGMAIVPDDDEALWAIGPASFSGNALSTVEAPDLTLQTFDGAEFRLSSLRGTRTVLVAWAPY